MNYDPVNELVNVHNIAGKLAVEQSRGNDGFRCTRRQIEFQNSPIHIINLGGGSVPAPAPATGVFRFDISSFDGTDTFA